MSILIALVISGIILVMLASINDARRAEGPPASTSTPTVVSPIVSSDTAPPVAQSANQPAASNQSAALQQSAGNGGEPCVNGCLLDNMCGGIQSIIARFDPNNATRYFYPPEHPDYQAFREAETFGETNFYFCSVAQAEAQQWTRAPQ